MEGTQDSAAEPRNPGPKAPDSQALRTQAGKGLAAALLLWALKNSLDGAGISTACSSHPSPGSVGTEL